MSALLLPPPPPPVHPTGLPAAGRRARAHPRPPCWRDVVLPSPWPGIILTAGFFWLIFAAVMNSYRDHRGDLWAVLVQGALLFGVLPAVYAARRLSSHARLEALRKEFGVPERGGSVDLAALRSASLTGLLRTFGPPLAVFALLLPAYLLVVFLGKDYWCRPELDRRQWVGVALVLDGLACVCAATACGAAGAPDRSGGRPGRPRVRPAFTFILLRTLTMAAAAPNALIDAWTLDRSLGAQMTFACTDALVCLTLAIIFTPLALRRLGRQLCGIHTSSPPLEPSPARPAPPDPELLAGAGLDVSAWSLLRWRFWRDPLVRAERRHFWSTGRIVLLWVTLPAVLVGLSVAFSLMGRPLSGLCPAVSLVSIVNGLPIACLPVFFMAILIHGEKNSAVLESMMVTFVTPLRLVAAKLAGKLWHLLIALAVLSQVAEYASTVLVLRLVTSTWFFDWITAIPHPVMRTAMSVLTWASFHLAYASMGLFFALRQRTLSAAAGFSVIAVTALLAAETVLCGMFSGEMGVMYFLWLVAPAMTVLHLALTALFLAGAARHLVLRREETGGSASA